MIRFITLLSLVLLPRLAGAWGAGHEDVARAVMARLPKEVSAKFAPEVVKEAIQHDSHYPDSFEPFLAADVGDTAVEALKNAGLKSRHDLHLDHGRVASFAMLVEALREGDPAHIAHWVAAHSHVIADMAACNHDPIVHTATYGWGPWKVKLPHAGDFSKVAPMLDLGGPARDTAGGTAAFDAAVERMMLHDEGRDAAQQIQEILLYGQDGARFCSSRGVKVLQGAAAWVDTQDAKGRELLWRNISELGAWAVVRTLRDVEVAMRFARDGVRIELSPGDRAAANSAVEALMRERRLDEDALFAPIIRELKPSDEHIIGVVLEPTWEMNDAMLGFSSRVQSAATVRTLHTLGRPHATFDVRRLLADGFPAPKQVPLMVVVATSFTGYHALKTEAFDTALDAYVKAGGRVLWVMGSGIVPKKTFATFAAAMKRAEKATLPVPGKEFVGSKVVAHLRGEPSWSVVNTPETPAGWQRPLCGWTFDLASGASLEPLISLDTAGTKRTIGAITSDRTLALLPIYAVTPYLLQNERGPSSPAQPELDEPSTTILVGAIDQLLAR